MFKRLPVLVTGVQIATKQIDEGIAAGQLAAEAGAAWMDLNCGCPIYGWQSSQLPCRHLGKFLPCMCTTDHHASLMQWAHCLFVAIGL